MDRSLRADYRVANHIKADFYFRSDCRKTSAALLSQADDFCTLAKGNCLVCLSEGEEVPKGCCVKVLSDRVALFVNLSGILDVAVETARLRKEVER